MIVRPTENADYFHARAIEEEVAAQRATCAAARDRHDEMATMYSFREMLARSRPPATTRTFFRVAAEPAPTA
jgi:hypothetical protein